MKDARMKEIVRKACLRDGQSKRLVARTLGISRNTVRKLLKEPGIPAYHLKEAKSKPVMGRFIPIIEAWLQQDQEAPRKQRHTARRIYERLVEEHGFPGSERRVREIVAQLKEKPRESYLPLAFAPGEMAQVDWVEIWVTLNGTLQKLYVFVLTLNFSGGIYVEAFDCMVQEAFFQGHHNAFFFFGGVPYTLTYDNLKTAVQKILEGRNRIENERFVAFRSAWLFDSRFCNPAKGNEKGRVENMAKFIERNFFTPVPQVDSLEALNALLRQRCLDYQTRTQARQTQTVGERLNQEKPTFIPLPQYPPECCRMIPVKADKSALVQFETNRYSVPCEYAYHTLWLKAFVDRVEITNTEKTLAVYTRLKGRNQESIRFDHYRKLLERKPGGYEHLRAMDKEPLPLKSSEPPERATYPQVTVQAPDVTIYRQLRSAHYDTDPTPSRDSGNLSESPSLARSG